MSATRTIAAKAPRTRIAELFNGKPPVIPFLTAGYPSRPVFLDAATAVIDAGASALEIGIPFSDPLADGPAIQFSSQVALANGMNLDEVLKLAEKVRRRTDRPIILMGYLNPVLRMGFDRFAAAAQRAGVDGTIIPDCPVDEADEWIGSSRRHELANIFLIAPTTPSARMAVIDRRSTAFSYCVSVTGVTGARRDFAQATRQYLRRVRQVAKKPFVVGFGISRPEHIKSLHGLADGFVVGSALVNVMQQYPRSRAAIQVGRAVKKLVNAT
jgi:tryptophan synthase alpha chain